MQVILKTGLAAAKKNAGPGLLLQSFALLLVLLYYFHEPTRTILLTIPGVQQRMGIWFPILATALFGGVIPYIFLLLRKSIVPGRYTATLLFMVGFWAILGLSVNTLYIIQARLFGNEPNAATVIKKVLVDQFIFCVIWSAPLTTIAMLWKDHDFSAKATRRDLSLRFITRDVPTVLIAMWGVWIPTVAIVYCLPLALQFPLFNLVLCFWSLLLSALNYGENHDHPVQPISDS
jgi:hypothetical protein